MTEEEAGMLVQATPEQNLHGDHFENDIPGASNSNSHPPDSDNDHDEPNHTASHLPSSIPLSQRPMVETQSMREQPGRYHPKSVHTAFLPPPPLPINSPAPVHAPAQIKHDGEGRHPIERESHERLSGSQDAPDTPDQGGDTLLEGREAGAGHPESQLIATLRNSGQEMESEGEMEDDESSDGRDGDVSEDHSEGDRAPTQSLAPRYFSKSIIQGTPASSADDVEAIDEPSQSASGPSTQRHPTNPVHPHEDDEAGGGNSMAFQPNRPHGEYTVATVLAAGPENVVEDPSLMERSDRQATAQAVDRPASQKPATPLVLATLSPGSQSMKQAVARARNHMFRPADPSENPVENPGEASVPHLQEDDSVGLPRADPYAGDEQQPDSFLVGDVSAISRSKRKQADEVLERTSVQMKGRAEGSGRLSGRATRDHGRQLETASKNEKKRTITIVDDEESEEDHEVEVVATASLAANGRSQAGSAEKEGSNKRRKLAVVETEITEGQSQSQEVRRPGRRSLRPATEGIEDEAMPAAIDHENERRPQSNSPEVDMDARLRTESEAPPTSNGSRSTIQPGRIPSNRRLVKTSLNPSKGPELNGDGLEDTMANNAASHAEINGPRTATQSEFQPSSTARKNLTGGESSPGKSSKIATKSTSGTTQQRKVTRTASGGEGFEASSATTNQDRDQLRETFNPPPLPKRPTHVYGGKRVSKRGPADPSSMPPSPESGDDAPTIQAKGKGKEVFVPGGDSDDGVNDEMTGMGEEHAPEERNLSTRVSSRRASGIKGHHTSGGDLSITNAAKMSLKRGRGQKSSEDGSPGADAGPSMKRRRHSVAVQAAAEDTETDEDHAEGTRMSVEAPIQPEIGVRKASRVFAVWSADKHMYPGTIIGNNGRNYDVLFDDDTQASIKISNLRLCMLKVGDVVDSTMKDINKRVGEMEVTGFKDPAEDEMQANEMVSLKKVSNGEVVADIAIGKLRIKPRRMPLLNDRRVAADQLRPVIPPEPPKHVGLAQVKAERVLSPVRLQSDVFRGKGFVITNPHGSPKETQTLSSLLTRNGGTVCGELWEFFDRTSEAFELRPSASGLHGIYMMVVGAPLPTPKFLTALAIGVPCISSRFASDCLVNHNVNWKAYLLAAGHSNYLDSQKSQCVHPSWGMDDFTPAFTSDGIDRPFSGKQVHICRDVHVVFTDLIRLMGGTPTTIPRLQSASDISGADFVIVQKKCPDFFRDDEKIGNTDWVKQCLIMGRLVPGKLE